MDQAKTPSFLRYQALMLAASLIFMPATMVLSAEAAGTPGAAPTTVDNVNELQSLDEVVVTGKLDSLSGIKKAIQQSEEAFYARWDEVNKERDWDIQCRTTEPTGTRIAVRICEPQIVGDVLHDQAMQMLGQGGNVRFNSPDEMRAAMAPDLQAKMLKAVKSDPQLLLALVQHAKLVQLYQDTRKKKFAGHWIVGD